MFKSRKQLLLVLFAAFLFTVGLLFPNRGIAQKMASETDTLYNQHSAKTATYWSFLPGAGQVYNKKYWKLPIVYAGFGVIGYFAVTNRQEYLKYHDAYVCSATLGEECDNELADKYSTDDLRSIRDYYRRNMELSYIFGGIWYVLQMIDAVVDAHLFYWNVDDDITVRVQPVVTPSVTIPQTSLQGNQHSMNGIKITVKF